MRYLRAAIVAMCFMLTSVGVARAADKFSTGCFNVSTPAVISYASGSISISYQICYSGSDASSFTWNSTVTYTNVDWGGGFQINGSVSMVLTYSNNSINSLNFSGGPLNYTIAGQPYTVTFNNLTFNFGSGLQVISATGSLTINGTKISANEGYWPYLFH